MICPLCKANRNPGKYIGISSPVQILTFPTFLLRHDRYNNVIALFCQMIHKIKSERDYAVLGYACQLFHPRSVPISSKVFCMQHRTD
jgi:hypothetical protein